MTSKQNNISKQKTEDIHITKPVLKKEKLLAELSRVNKELLFQNTENEKRTAELIIANAALIFENHEKEKCAIELTHANKQLLLQHSEKEKRATELVIANKELLFQNKEKEKRAAELVIANHELQKAEEQQKVYILGLKEMIFMTSHNLRQPIAHIIGLSRLLDDDNNSLDELKQMVGYMKDSANALDVFSRELTEFMHEQQIKVKE